MWRSVIVILGALPASVLGSFAIGVIFGGIRSLASAEAVGALFVAWGILGIAGAAGLWLAAIELSTRPRAPTGTGWERTPGGQSSRQREMR